MNIFNSVSQNSVSQIFKSLKFLLVLMIITAFSSQLYAQSTGDYRSNGTGNWITLSSWQYYNGTSWVTPSGTSPQGYPGQFAGTGAVTILSGHTITLNAAITTQTFGTLEVLGTLQLTGNATFTLYTSRVIALGTGIVNFTNKVTLILSANAILQCDAGSLTGDCNANQAIQIGSTTFAQCQGGAGDTYTFAQLIAAGGTLNAIPTSNSPICQGGTINLTGSYGGAIGTTPTYSWSVTAPGGGSPTIFNTQNATINTALSGTYTAVLSVSTVLSGTTLTNSETILILVRIPSTAPTSISGTTTICSGSTTTLTATGGTLGDGASYQWGTGSTVGSNIISGAASVSYTTDALSSTTTYWVRRVDPAPCNTLTGGVTTTVTVNSISTAPTTITGVQRICSGSSTTLTASGGVLGTGGNYQWGTGNVVGSNIISGATNDSYTTVALSSTTTYWVRRIDPAPCNTITTGVTATVIISNADVLTWNGSVSNNWHTPANWTPNYIPISCDNVIIPTGLTTYPTITTAATCNNISIQSGASVIGNVNLTVGGASSVIQALSSYRSWYIISPVSGTITPTPDAGTLAIYSYLESANDDQTSGISWLPISTMSPEQGYFVTPSGAGTTKITFVGSLNDGLKQFTLTRNNHAGKVKNGFNLVGNPYPSYLDWTALYAANTSILPEATMYYRTKVGGTYYFWTVNGSGIGSPSQASKYVPPMQAFWVRTITGGGTLNLTNAMRLHDASGTNLLKAPAAKTAVNKILRLQVSKGTTTDETVVYFNTNAADGFDAYDSPKMINGSTSTVPDIYTTLGVEKLAINGMSSIPYDTEIPLYFVANASAGTSYSIIANELSDFEVGTQVWIKNNLSGVEQLVSDGTSYAFDIADTGTNPKFSIIFKAPGATTQLENAKNNNMFAYLNANNQITVSCSDALSGDANVSVYNSLGQRIVRKALTKSLTRIDYQLTAGVYMVTVFNAGNKTTEKIIIR